MSSVAGFVRNRFSPVTFLLLADAGDELKKKLDELKGTPLTIDQAPLRPARPGN